MCKERERLSNSSQELLLEWEQEAGDHLVEREERPVTMSVMKRNGL